MTRMKPKKMIAMMKKINCISFLCATCGLYACILKGDESEIPLVVFSPPVEAFVIDGQFEVTYQATEKHAGGILVGYNIDVSDFSLIRINKVNIEDFSLYLPICSTISRHLNNNVVVKFCHDCDDAAHIVAEIVAPGFMSSQKIVPGGKNPKTENDSFGMSMIVDQEDEWEEFIIEAPGKYLGELFVVRGGSDVEPKKLSVSEKKEESLILDWNGESQELHIKSEGSIDYFKAEIKLKILDTPDKRIRILVGGYGLRIPI